MILESLSKTKKTKNHHQKTSHIQAMDSHRKDILMTKIILAFPCMGKTYYAQNNPEKAIDLESSDYFFDRTGYEHLSSEEFKGIANRKPNPNGVTDYLKAIDDAASSGKYEYIFTAQHPDVVKGIIDMGYDVYYVNQFQPMRLKRNLKEEYQIVVIINNG